MLGIQTTFQYYQRKRHTNSFEAGNGNDGSAWNSILKDIYNVTGTTLITYDRAGLGQSEIDTTKISFK